MISPDESSPSSSTIPLRYSGSSNAGLVGAESEVAGVADGYLGNVLQETVQRQTGPLPCPYDICPCTTPANRGMIEGL